LPAFGPCRRDDGEAQEGLMEPKHGVLRELHSATFRFKLIITCTQRANTRSFVRRPFRLGSYAMLQWRCKLPGFDINS
jgi:hypothetical protein